VSWKLLAARGKFKFMSKLKKTRDFCPSWVSTSSKLQTYHKPSLLNEPRTSYIICRLNCKKTFWVPCSKTRKNILLKILRLVRFPFLQSFSGHYKVFIYLFLNVVWGYWWANPDHHSSRGEDSACLQLWT
jgi:hypothetical protein